MPILFKTRIFCRLIIFWTIALIISGNFYSCKNTNTKLVVFYGQELEYMKDIAKKKNKMLCVVLSRPDCPPCEHYVQNIDELYKHLASKAIFNIVNVSLPENQWYLHWLCTGGSPTTCIFSPDGELIAVVAGIKRNAVECIKLSIAGDTQCADYFHARHYFAKDGQRMQALNALLSGKQNLDKGEDIRHIISASLNQSTNPYAIYLKSLNEEKQGHHEEAVFWAEQFLDAISSNSYYSRVYSNVLGQIKTIINPNYSPFDEGMLSVTKELSLGDHQLNQSTPFSLMLTNTGKSPLLVHDIRLSCSCVKIKGERRLALQPGESQKMEFIFTADVKGNVIREITFFSNGVYLMETVKITATVM